LPQRQDRTAVDEDFAEVVEAMAVQHRDGDREQHGDAAEREPG
jgi:hypothetical protein